MFAPEEQQMEICLLKSNLEEIENDLVAHRSALPALDAENEHKYRETMAALKVVRTLNTEIEKLKQENIQLTAKRMQLKRECDDIAKNLETAHENRDKLKESLKQEEQETELIIRKYEDSLREKADRFRRTSGYYNEKEINTEIGNVNNVIAKLEDGLSKKQSGVDELRVQLDGIHAEVPENLLEKFGKLELEEKVKSLAKKYEGLVEKRKSKME